jgi:hypothetical protein
LKDGEQLQLLKNEELKTSPPLLFVLAEFMVKSRNSDSGKRKRGRPVTTGTGTTIGVRMLDDLVEAVDRWTTKQREPLSRPEAIRRLVEIGLTPR